MRRYTKNKFGFKNSTFCYRNIKKGCLRHWTSSLNVMQDYAEEELRKAGLEISKKPILQFIKLQIKTDSETFPPIFEYKIIKIAECYEVFYIKK